MTLFALRTRDDVLAVRFATSPLWETCAAVRLFGDERARRHHEPWLRLVRDRAERLDLAPLLALHQRRGYVPDFLTPPPRTARPRLRDQLAEMRSTPPEQVSRELERSRETVAEPREQRLIDELLVDPAAGRDRLAATLQEAWQTLVAPFWTRIRTLLDRDLDRRSRTLAREGYRRALDEIHPRLRWTSRGLSCLDRTGTTVDVDERGLVLMPSAFSGPQIAAFVDPPWLPTIVYPAQGIAELWRTPPAPREALGRLLGRTRALVLAGLDAPASTTSLAALLELSPAGASRHLLALRDAGLVSAQRHGHEVRYARTGLGEALLRGRASSPRPARPREPDRGPGLAVATRRA